MSADHPRRKPHAGGNSLHIVPSLSDLPGCLELNYSTGDKKSFCASRNPTISCFFLPFLSCYFKQALRRDYTKYYKMTGCHGRRELGITFGILPKK